MAAALREERPDRWRGPGRHAEEERAISASTPRCRFGGATAPATAETEATATTASAANEATATPAAVAACTPTPRRSGASTAAVPSPVDPEMASHVHVLIEDRTQPVLMFALEWCEFCWTVHRLFERLGVSCRTIELDSVAYQAADRGGRVRTVLPGWLQAR